mmetsp:Transcript_23972/g.74603  ORF Transcript_23972/g.74603 Transcript_23972/m.74603 type:complete len:263 (-) Transcript_23972:44-832(-)
MQLHTAGSAFGRSSELLGPAVVQRLVVAFLQWPANAGAPSLCDAAEAGNTQAVWAHLNRGASPDDYDAHGCVPLHYVAEGNHVGAYRLLVRAQADINAPHVGLNIRVGWTPLHFAAYAGSRDVLLLLLLQGAGVNEMDRCRRTALFYAQSRGRKTCSRLLAKFGGVEDLHLVEPRHLREAQRADDGAHFATEHDRDEHHWDASADAADMYAEGAVPVQFPEGNAVDRHHQARSVPLPRYIGPAGDSGPSLTHAAMSMPGFEW